ncbi:hypothetical protein HZS_822 [Henneguya salminicola]|nr:hypothetical protein HZS_822 [Henneguya salminicola]
MNLCAQELHKSLSICIGGEIGRDYGGISREWFEIVSKELQNPIHCLLTCCSNNNLLHIDPASGLGSNNLSYFRFFGRFLGIGLFHTLFFNGWFDSSFYKKLLGRQICLEDFKSRDEQIYKSLIILQEENIETLEMDLTFSVEHEVDGKLKETELIQGGKNIKVIESNKENYIKLFADYYLNTNTTTQFNEILIGFHEMIPSPWISFLDEKELEVCSILSGIQIYNLEDWKSNTIYENGYNATSPQILWFWEVVKKMEHQDRSQLVQFATGTSHIPVSGFGDLYGSYAKQLFCIEKWEEPSYLPQSHTCRNQINLPPYNSYEELEKKLLLAIHESSGFHQN